MTEAAKAGDAQGVGRATAARTEYHGVPLVGGARAAELSGTGGDAAAWTPAGIQRTARLARRRVLMLALNLGSLCALLLLCAVALGGLQDGQQGLGWVDWGILLTVALSAPWTILGFWNAVVGLWLLRVARRSGERVSPFWIDQDRSGPITARTALLMAVRNEDIDRVAARLLAMRRGLDAGAHGDRFDIFILSDTNDPDIAAREAALVAEQQTALAGKGAVFYRRRSDNAGFKAGNLREWVETRGADYAFMLTLDADSLMGARLIERMVRTMQRLPRLGILQSLAVGAPASSGFARVFQFGMRHGMRSFTVGSAWWQGDCGPYWGHNAVIRVAPFKAHCQLPELPGRPPLGGPILSHDQVEAALMRAAGYEVRVAPVEGESWEENPVTVLDFMRREQRWCNGNMQYWPLLTLRGLTVVSRFQLLQAIMMYLGSPAWMAMTVLAAVKAISLGAVAEVDAAAAAALAPTSAFGLSGAALGAILFFTMFAMSLAPKIAGVIDVALQPGGMARYGGPRRFAVGVFVEIAFGMLMAPAMALRLTIFLIGLLLGRGVKWSGQVRDAYGLAWSTALARLWPQTVFGLALTIALAWRQPTLLPWASPVLLGLIFAAPFAVLTASPGFGRFLRRYGLCAIPEDHAPPPALTAAFAPPAEPFASAPSASGLGRPLGTGGAQEPAR